MRCVVTVPAAVLVEDDSESDFNSRQIWPASCGPFSLKGSHRESGRKMVAVQGLEPRTLRI